MVVILFLSIPHNILQDFLTLRVILLCFPLNALFFLQEREIRTKKQKKIQTKQSHIYDYFITTKEQPHVT